MKITSPLFRHGEHIPQMFTCLGPNINPPLRLEEVPHNAQSMVLIFEDVDATPKPGKHWMLFDILPSTTEVTEATIPNGAQQKDWQTIIALDMKALVPNILKAHITTCLGYMLLI